MVAPARALPVPDKFEHWSLKTEAVILRRKGESF